MNVTNIGSPFIASASQGGVADATTGIGFAGLLGAVAGDTGQGQMTFGLAGGTPQLGTPLLAAQTNAPLMPATLDPGTTLPGEKPQVALAQLLATAAPGAVTPPVATGGNPLADAVAKALANAQGKTAVAETAPVAAPATEAQPPATVPTAVPVAAAPTPAKPQPAAAQPNAVEATPVPAKPDAADALAVALDAPAQAPAETPTLPRPNASIKAGTKPARGSENAGIDPAGAPLPAPDAVAATLVQPIAVPVAQPQPIAQPATPQPASQGKASGVIAPRAAKVEANAGTDPAPLQTTNDKMAEIADALGTGAQGGATDSGPKGENGQQAFGQQLAAVDAHHASAMPMTAGAAPLGTTAPNAAPAAATAEPVINARPGELGRSLGVEIARKVDAGEDTLRVRLNPAELGRVEVTLAFDDKGRVQATMRAESQHTLDLLRQDAPDLGRALDQAGIRSDSSSFRFESRDGGSGSGSNSQSAFQQQSRGGNQQFREEPETQAAAYRPIRGDGQVDLIA
jgi:flagellar hook-length control protein FliK